MFTTGQQDGAPITSVLQFLTAFNVTMRMGMLEKTDTLHCLDPEMNSCPR